MASKVKKSPVAFGFLQVARAIIVFTFGGIVVHLAVMLLDYFLMIRPLRIDLRADFAVSIFSIPMFPMIAAYGLLVLAIYLLWEKKKNALLLAHKAKIKREKVDAALKSMQTITGFLAEHIAIQNSEILQWIEFRNRKGKIVSERVEKLSKKIAKTLQVLSETSFVIPFSEHRPKDVAEIAAILNARLNEIDTDRPFKTPSDSYLQ